MNNIHMVLINWSEQLNGRGEWYYKYNLFVMEDLVCVSARKCRVTEWECKCNCRSGLWSTRMHKYQNQSVGTWISARMGVLKWIVPKQIPVRERVSMS